MARALSPAYIRLGGTAADLLTFKPSGKSTAARMNKSLKLATVDKSDKLVTVDKSDKVCNETDCWCADTISGEKVCENLAELYQHRKKFVMTGEDLEKGAGLTLLFDLNLLKRIWRRGRG